MKPKAVSLKKTNIINKSLFRLSRKKREKIQVTDIKNETANIITDPRRKDRKRLS